jgi:hypothetical protein
MSTSHESPCITKQKKQRGEGAATVTKHWTRWTDDACHPKIQTNKKNQSVMEVKLFTHHPICFLWIKSLTSSPHSDLNIWRFGPPCGLDCVTKDRRQ